MSNATSRQQCADANSVFASNTVFNVVAQGAPGAAATVGMFTFAAVGKTGPSGMLPVNATDPRFPFRPAVLSLVGALFGCVKPRTRARQASARAP